MMRWHSSYHADERDKLMAHAQRMYDAAESYYHKGTPREARLRQMGDRALDEACEHDRFA